MVMGVPDLLVKYGVKVIYHKTDDRIKGFWNKWYRFNNRMYASIRNRMK